MRLFLALASLLILSGGFCAEFIFTGFLNGTNPEFSEDSLLFNMPSGVLYAKGKLLVSDSGKGSLYIFNASKRVNMITSSGGQALTSPLRMSYQDGLIYIADGNSGRIKTYEGVGSEINDWNLHTNMNKPSGIAFDSENAYITDMVNGKVYAYSRSTRSFSKIAVESGESDGFLTSPADIESYGGKFFISDSSKGLIFVYDSNFTYLYAIGRGKGGVVLKSPKGLHAWNDMLFVADSSANKVVVFTLTGYPIEVLDSKANLSYPEDVFVYENTVYVADAFNRQVKMFNFTKPQGNPEVLRQIQSANSSSQELYEIARAAKSLNLSPREESFQESISEALEEYSNYQFSAALRIAERVKEAVEVSKQEIGQAIEIKAKQIAKESQDTVAPYKNTSKSDSVLLAMLSEFDQRISDLEAKLRLKNYEQAAQLALSLPKLADGIKKHAESLKASKNTSQESQAALSAKLEELGSRIVALQSKAQEYRQAINLSNAVSLVQKANASILSGDIESANSSLYFAEIDIRVHESILEKRILEIDAARSNLTILEAQLNLSLSKPSLIKPDIKQEQSIFAQAKEEVFDNPAAALEAAKKAVESANAKVKDAQTVSVAAAALLVMFSFIGALFIAFFLHIRGKKRGRL